VNYELKLGRSYFSRQLDGVRVIGLNAMLAGSALPQEKRMWHMLERERAKPAAPPTLLLLHLPPFIKAADEPGGQYTHWEPAPRQRLLALLPQLQAKAVLSGHLHRSVSNRHENVLFLTVPSSTVGAATNKIAARWTLITVDQGRVQTSPQQVVQPGRTEAVQGQVTRPPAAGR
jgi:3',5'-cyclic AMP phosphodiesterase CpdA